MALDEEFRGQNMIRISACYGLIHILKNFGMRKCCQVFGSFPDFGIWSLAVRKKKDLGFRFDEEFSGYPHLRMIFEARHTPALYARSFSRRQPSSYCRSPSSISIYAGEPNPPDCRARPVRRTRRRPSLPGPRSSSRGVRVQPTGKNACVHT